MFARKKGFYRTCKPLFAIYCWNLESYSSRSRPVHLSMVANRFSSEWNLINSSVLNILTSHIAASYSILVLLLRLISLMIFPQTALELNGVLNSSKKQSFFHHDFLVPGFRDRFADLWATKNTDGCSVTKMLCPGFAMVSERLWATGASLWTWVHARCT